MFKFAMTGHAGLIGTFLKKRLEEEDNQCVLKMDLREGDDILYDIDHKKCNADIMFHLASNCKINKCVKSPNWSFENVKGIHKVLEFCRKNNIKKIVAFSSSRILSKERNPYTAAKIYLEELCKAYSACYGIKYIIIRPSTVYGPFRDKTNRLMDIWIRAALNGDNLKIYGNPKTKTLGFTYVDDFVDGVMLALKVNKWNLEYNISGGEEDNLSKLAKFIIKETKSKSKISILDPEVEQPQQVNVDISKIKSIGYSPKVELDEGVRRNISFYKK